MPAKSKAQQRWAWSQLEDNTTSMTKGQLEEFAHTKTKGLPKHAKPKKGK